MSTKPSSLIQFYDPHTQGKDTQGRTLNQILAWDDHSLEFHHDYIQTLFPLPESSPINPYAPTIDKPTFDAFHSDPNLQHRLKDSLTRMLTFYGFSKLEDGAGSIIIVRGVNFETASRKWVTRFDHNHLRITRIIRSLRVLGLEAEARGFFEALKEVWERSGVIGRRSLVFWTRAAERPLFLAPEDEDGTMGGVDFLREFEAKRESEVVDG